MLTCKPKAINSLNKSGRKFLSDKGPANRGVQSFSSLNCTEQVRHVVSKRNIVLTVKDEVGNF